MEFAIGIVVAGTVILIWLTWLTYKWRTEQSKRKQAEQENEYLWRYIIQNLYGKEEGK